MNDLGITWAGAYNRSIVVPNGADQGNLRRNAVPAILDAMIATLFADLLTDDEREELLEPLRRVTEPQPEAARVTDPAPALTVGVIGAGTMGAGIAQVCLQAGHDVLLFDVDHAAIERGRGRIADGLQRLVDKDKLPPGGRARMLDALRDAHSLEGLAEEADIVIEAALEDLELKETIFRALGSAEALPDIIATNTSALSVSDIAEASGHADRVIGLHFFNPAPVMPLVEVVIGDRTARETIVKAMRFARELGKEPVASTDSPGFIVNRVNRPFTLEALRMLEAREAGVEQIDRALRAPATPWGRSS